MIKWIKNIIRKWKRKKEIDRKLKELRKRDPFKYPHV